MLVGACESASLGTIARKSALKVGAQGAVGGRGAWCISCAQRTSKHDYSSVTRLTDAGLLVLAHPLPACAHLLAQQGFLIPASDFSTQLQRSSRASPGRKHWLAHEGSPKSVIERAAFTDECDIADYSFSCFEQRR